MPSTTTGKENVMRSLSTSKRMPKFWTPRRLETLIVLLAIVAAMFVADSCNVADTDNYARQHEAGMSMEGNDGR